MRGLFIDENSKDPVPDLVSKIVNQFDKVAVQDLMSNPAALIEALNQTKVVTSVWTATPDNTDRLISYGTKQIIIQAEDNQGEASIANIRALRKSGYKGLLSVVTNLWPSRNTPNWDKFMHSNNVRLLVECYLPENGNETVKGMTDEAHWRGYPHCEPVLGCYWGYSLKDYDPLPHTYWIWDADQMTPDDWYR